MWVTAPVSEAGHLLVAGDLDHTRDAVCRVAVEGDTEAFGREHRSQEIRWDAVSRGKEDIRAAVLRRTGVRAGAAALVGRDQPVVVAVEVKRADLWVGHVHGTTPYSSGVR